MKVAQIFSLGGRYRDDYDGYGHGYGHYRYGGYRRYYYGGYRRYYSGGCGY